MHNHFYEFNLIQRSHGIFVLKSGVLRNEQFRRILFCITFLPNSLLAVCACFAGFLIFFPSVSVLNHSQGSVLLWQTQPTRESVSRSFTRKVRTSVNICNQNTVDVLTFHHHFFNVSFLSVEDLLKYLDPQFTDFIAVPDAMKLEFILAG